MVFLSYGFREHFQSNGYSPLEHSILAPWPLIFFSFMKKGKTLLKLISKVESGATKTLHFIMVQELPSEQLAGRNNHDEI